MFKKIKKVLKGLLATTLSATTTLSGIAAIATQTVSAADDWTLETSTVDTAFVFDDNGHNYSETQTPIYTLRNNNTNQTQIVFGLQPGKPASAGNAYDNADLIMDDWSEENKKKVNLAGIYYYYQGSGIPTNSAENTNIRTAVQWYLWQVAFWEGEGTDGVKHPGATLDFSTMQTNSGNATTYADVKAAYDNLVAWIDETMNTSIKHINGGHLNADGSFTLYPGETLTFMKTDSSNIPKQLGFGVDVGNISDTGITTDNSLGYGANIKVAGTFSGEKIYNDFVLLEQFKEIRERNDYFNQFTIFTSSNYQGLVSPFGTVHYVPYKLEVDARVVSGKITVNSTSEKDNTPLEGTKFEVYDSNSIKVSELTTDANGTASTDYLPTLPAGSTYTVKEVNPTTGHNNSNSTGKSVTITAGTENTLVNFQDSVIKGNVKFTKVSSDNQTPVETVYFDIYQISDAFGTLATERRIGSVFSDFDTGIGDYSNLEYGNYYLIETIGSMGYVADKNTKIPFSITENGVTVDIGNIENDPQYLEITIKVEDSNIDGFGLDENNKKLKIEGAKFELYLSNPSYITNDLKVGEATTNADGIAKFRVQTPTYEIAENDDFTYHIRQVEAPEGYIINTEEKSFKFEYFADDTQEKALITKEINYTNDAAGISITINRTDVETDAPLAGAKFEVRDANGDLVDTVTTDTNGTATSKALRVGTYTVKEIEAPANYPLISGTKEARVYNTANGLKSDSVTFENESMKKEITINKVDRETNAPLAGAKYEILDESNNLVDTVTTNANGVATSIALRPGTYKVKEVKAPEGYQLTNIKDFAGAIQGTVIKEVEIIATANGLTCDTVTFTSLHNKGKITVTKVDSETVDYNESCDGAGQNCVSTPVLKNDSVLIPNVEFAIYSKGNTTTPVATGKTDANGIFSVILNTGEYYLKETKVPAGYNLNTSLVEFKLTNHGEEVKKVITNVTLSGDLTISKTGEQIIGAPVNEDTNITEFVFKDAYIAGAEFELYAKEDILHPITNKVIYAKDELIKTLTTGNDGKITITNLPLGKYYVKETKAPVGHSLGDDNVKDVILAESDVNAEGLIKKDLAFVNDRTIINPQLEVKGANLISDTNTETKYEYVGIKDAEFGIYNKEEIKYIDESGKEQVIPANTLLGKMTSDENGFAETKEKLPFGKYYVKQTKAPKGYYINEDTFDFETEWTKDIQDKKVLVVEVPEEPVINYQKVMPNTGIKVITYTGITAAVITIIGAIAIVSKKRKIEE